MDYVQYTLTDSLGTSDQGIIKIGKKSTHRRSAIRLCGQLSEPKTLPFLPVLPSISFLQRWSKCAGCNPLPLHTWRYFIGQDSFTFPTPMVPSWIIMRVSSMREIPALCAMMSLHRKNTPITFDVFANDLVKTFPITEYSPQLVHDTWASSPIPRQPTSVATNYLPTKVDSGVSIETSKITLVVGNQNPQADIIYKYDVPGKALWWITMCPSPVIHFVIDPAKNQNTVWPTPSRISLVLAVAPLMARPSSPIHLTMVFTGGDTMEIKYCVANNPVCVTYKLYFNVLPTPACLPLYRRLCLGGDLNGDGKVTARPAYPGPLSWLSRPCQRYSHHSLGRQRSRRLGRTAA